MKLDWRCGFLSNCSHNLSQPSFTAIASCLTLIVTALPGLTEGSRNLYPNGATGSRANIEWRSESAYGGSPVSIRRRTLLKVYANAGEYILLGSSAEKVGLGNILIFNPGRVSGVPGQETIPSSPDFQCSSQSGRGQITSRTLELQGPRSRSGTGNPTGYIPCYYQAPASGVYDVIFYGPSGNANNNPTPTGNIDSIETGSAQQTSIAAWDVTVRSNDINSITDLNGRLFSYYLALYTGGNNRPLRSSFYPVTTDGYRYRVELRDLDPNGFLVYGNQVGYFDSDGKTPLYHNVIGSTTDGLLGNLQGGVSLAVPQFPIFFTSSIDVTALANAPLYDPFGRAIGTGLPLTPSFPSVSSGTFAGTAGFNSTNQNTGGTFTFNSSLSGTYQIYIRQPGQPDDPTHPNNRVLRGLMTFAGSQSITWDGRANNGSFFPVGSNYTVEIQVHSGEYHFPLIDAENSTLGGPTLTLLNAANPLGNTRGFYDDRGYRTVAGTTVGSLTELLCRGSVGSNPNPPFSNSRTGFDTGSSQRAFGATSGTTNANSPCTLSPTGGSQSGAFGDVKGLDIWTYFPSNAEILSFNIVPPIPKLRLVKRITAINATNLDGFVDGAGEDDDATNYWATPASTYLRGKIEGVVVQPGDEVEYTIYFLNSQAAAKNATICDLVPDNLTFVDKAYNINSGIALGFSDKNLPTDATEFLTNADDSDRGTYYPPNAANTPTVCKKFDASGKVTASGQAANTNGALVIKVVEGNTLLPPATSPGSPTNSYGFVRFRARLN